MRSAQVRLPWRALAALTAAACWAGSDADEPAAPAPSRSAPPMPMPRAPAPADLSSGDAARGAVAYATYCASCHGPRGDGDGALGVALDPRPARHSDGAVMNALSDEHLFRVIRDGGPAVGKSPLMAPWGGSLSDAEIVDVIAFIRSLAQPPYEAER